MAASPVFDIAPSSVPNAESVVDILEWQDVLEASSIVDEKAVSSISANDGLERMSMLRCMLRLLIAMKPTTSAIWNFFCEIDSNMVKCNICERIYSRNGGTTTLLKRHLKAFHRDKYEELLRLEKEPRLAIECDLKTLLEKAKNREGLQLLGPATTSADLSLTSSHTELFHFWAFQKHILSSIGEAGSEIGLRIGADLPLFKVTSPTPPAPSDSSQGRCFATETGGPEAT
ncbi:hypothetical protein J437_LFUL009635 [Ladona fulva]|uniref:BED-type domain-containing protein n=1 Tax=Ladona fulva TaxID=123851 RepID=A0A8K0K836_LADFU|nr:hypothetical protein J437_LFUL009635 [Ladona fulva]